MTGASRWKLACIVMCAAATRTLVGCGGTPNTPQMPAAPATESPTVASFDLSDLKPARILSFPAANINDIPIHVWVHRDAGGKVGTIRVTGHANAEVCSQASLDLLELLSDRTNVSGFLGFGVGELRPSASATAYQNRATDLLARMSALAAEYPDFVDVHDLSLEQADIDASSQEVTERTGVLRFRNPNVGPAFIPVRKWTRGKSPIPLNFQVSSRELGVDDVLMRQLAPGIASEPLVELVNLVRDRLNRIDRLHTFLSSGGSLVDPSKGYNVESRTGAASVEAMSQYNDLLTRYERFLDAVRFLTQVEPSEKIRQEHHSREAEAYRVENATCIRRVLAGYGCPRHFAVTLMMPTTDDEKKEVEATNTKLAQLSALPEEAFGALRRMAQSDLDRVKRELEMAHRQTSAQAESASRETTIDGLLRGWPLPVPDNPKLEERVSDIQENVTTGAWAKILDRIAADGIDLRDSTGPGGALNRGNLFFAVRDLGGGRYSVLPEYVVSGPYLEVWDPVRQSITIETKDEVGVLGRLARNDQ